MASVDLGASAGKVWLPANPWLWLGAGGALTIWSWLWKVAFGATANDGRVVVLALGLLSVGVGLWLRWSDRHIVYLRSPSCAGAVRFALGVVFAALALGMT